MNHREIDRLVAEKVMGYEVLDDMVFFSEGFPIDDFRPFERIEDAWKVVKKLGENYGVDIYTELGSPSIVKLWDDGEIIVEVISQNDLENIPFIICKAALKTVGIEVDE